MGNTLHNLLIAATIGLSMPSAFAQSESFTGLTGNSYYVDYENGLVMQLQGDQATVVSPAKVADQEFKPMAAKLESLAKEQMLTNEAFSIDNDKFQQLLKIWELQNNQYDTLITTFQNVSMEFLQQYYTLADILEKALELQAASKPGKPYGPAKAISTSFSFDIWEIISDLDYAEFMVNFTRDYLMEFEEDLNAFHEKLDESSEELDDILLGLDIFYKSHEAYILAISELLRDNIEYLSEETLLTIGEGIQEKVDDIKWELAHMPDNPAEFVESWAKYCIDSMQSTYENALETEERLASLADRIATLYYNFAGVLFAGPLGDEAGLYYTILHDNGSLILPPFAFSDDKQYFVTGVDGNIFSGMPEGVSITDLKLVLPGTISSISNEAFAIDGIKEVTVYSPSVPTLTADSFTEATYANAQLIVRDELLDTYKDSAVWSKFMDIIPESLAAVEEITGLNPEVRIEGSNLIVNTNADSLVNVYSADGRTIYSGRSNTIELPARGLYIVKTANRSTKVRY